MASLRKKYQGNGEDKDAPPVTTMPPGTEAKLPPIADARPPPEMPEPESSPAEQAAQTAIKQRLAEMERAEALTRQQQSAQQPQFATELAIEPQEPEQQQPTTEHIIASSSLPERMKNWLRQHPDYVTDPVKNNQIQRMHYVAEYQAGGEWTDLYFDRMERLLGFKQDAPPNGNGAQQLVRPAVQRQPVRQQQYAGPPVSAPPTRESPSMSTGRPVTRRGPLTQEQRDIARSSGISEEEYSRQLDRMEKMKAAGVIQDGR
jgi:hypothetical protein